MNEAPIGTAALPQDGQEHRLHPLSWLFVLIAQLKQFILPLIVLLFAGRGDRNDLWSLIAVGVLVIASLAEYFTYRYRLRSDGISIRSGWLHRSLREIPFARIHNVSVHQSLLHRMFGVAEVRLEAAGGIKPEAQMRVLRMNQALALEALVKRRGQAADAALEDETEQSPPLLTLSTGELIRLGLISNRGMLVVAAAFGALAQAGNDIFATLIERWGKLVFGWLTDTIGQHAHDSPLVIGLAIATLVIAALAALRLLSIALAILQFHGFTLREDDGRISVERGLLARSRSSAKRHRIQAWSLSEGVLHRWFRRRSLRVDTATGQRGAQEQHTLKDIAPIATPQRCDELIQHFLPEAGWGALDWQPLHRGAWLRIAVPGLLFVLAITGALFWRFGNIGLFALLLVPVQLWRARRIAAACGYADNGRMVAWRNGWLSKSWNFAEIGKIQAVRLSQSPLDRRLGMANLLLDTAGASPFGAPLHLYHLPMDAAEAMSARLVTQLARTRLQR
ncbi:PH domain-containing protein [Thermomonas sp. HDW16]|uniref:PH domain-containing protein n=1 Tax=Thermomonas sp. HDW16 TaxID=2714945 RepID=UPI00140B976A|nr:PH domain-containing protein [Thermomonas sp. HDW16]QIL19298.1 PH domain-containing protein [Thermomonas sp. HDW16]